MSGLHINFTQKQLRKRSGHLRNKQLLKGRDCRPERPELQFLEAHWGTGVWDEAPSLGQSPPTSAPPSASSSGSPRRSPAAAFSAIAPTRPAARAQERPPPPEPPVSPVRHRTSAARGRPDLCPSPGSPPVAAGKAAAPEGKCPA